MGKIFLSFGIFFLTLLFASIAFAASGDLIIVPNSIKFSKLSPLEGEPITISAMVKNQGAGNITEDIEVRFVEGDPKVGGLQIAYDAVIMGLKGGATGKTEVKWRAAPGVTKIYAIVDPDNLIKETKEDNNTASRTITGKKWQGPKATEKQISDAVKKGVEWLKSQQGEFYVICPNKHENFLYSAMAYSKCVICGSSLEGIEPTRASEQSMPGGWLAEIGPGMTALVVMTLLDAGLDESDEAVKSGIDHLLNKTPVKWDAWSDPYDFSLGILALGYTGNKEKYKEQIEFFLRQLESKQTEDGGWGYGTVADAAHLQYVILALYAAKQWGFDIKPDTWSRAAVWLTGMQRPDGGWNYYSAGSGPFAEDSYGSMTATAIMGLKAAGIPTGNESIKRGIEWLTKHYSISRNPGSFYWHYYYLVAVQRAMDIPPRQEMLGNYDWYSDMASYLISHQQSDGSWITDTPIYTVGNITEAPKAASGWGQNRGDIMATSFAIIFLTRVMPKPINPDLGFSPQSLKFSNANPTEGESVTITASISNYGGAKVEGTEVKFFNGEPTSGGTLIGSAKTTSPLDIDKKKEVSINWKPTGTGEYKIYAVVDPDNLVIEASESNNVISGSIKVGAEEAPAIPAMEKVGDGLYKLGNVELDLNKKTITVYGKVNMAYGLIELLACTKIGKVHESLLVLDVQPIHLQTALILLGLEYEGGIRYQGDPRTPKGDPVRIWVEWNKDGQIKRHRAEDLIFNRVKQSSMEHIDWVFTGSRINNNGTFMAQAVGTIITTFHDPDAIIDNPLPEGGDDTIYIVNNQIAPPKGTDIKMIIEPGGPIN